MFFIVIFFEILLHGMRVLHVRHSRKLSAYSSCSSLSSPLLEFFRLFDSSVSSMAADEIQARILIRDTPNKKSNERTPPSQPPSCFNTPTPLTRFSLQFCFFFKSVLGIQSFYLLCPFCLLSQRACIHCQWDQICPCAVTWATLFKPKRLIRNQTR